jgi:outer membrane receptor for ferrienterochelin and colicin
MEGLLFLCAREVLTMKAMLSLQCAFSILLVCNLVSPTGAFCGTTGILEGRLRDKNTHEAIVGATVVILGTHLGMSTDAEGMYRINNIRAGIYEVRFSILGYKIVIVKNVTIVPDLRTRVDVDMEQTTIEFEVVEVYAERPLIQKDLAATAFVVGSVKLEKLPVSSFQEVLLLQPSTTLEGNVRGGKSQEVVFLVDGLPVQDVIGGGLGTSLPRSSITEMTIHTGGFDAEYGNALSGVVNVITRGGGDTHTLDVRLERDSWLPTSINMQQDELSELEVTAAGPILKDRCTYFTANSYTGSNTRWWQDLDRFFSWPISQEFSGFGKIDYMVSPALKVSLQGIYSFRKWRDYEFSWRFDLSGLPARERDSYRAALLVSHSLSDRSFYTASLSVFHLKSLIGEGSKDQLSLQPYEYDFYLRYVLRGQKNWWASAGQTIYSFKTDFTTQIGQQHLLRAGMEMNQYALSSDLVKYEPQTTYFGKPILDEPLLNYGNSYTYAPRSGSIYIQDKFEVVRDGANLNLGVRWDFLDPTAERPVVEFIPVSSTEYRQTVAGRTKARFKQQFSPRFSVAAPVGPSSFLFVNFGHYFQFPLFDYLYSGITPAQVRQGARNVLAGNPDLEPERTRAYEIGFKHEVTRNVLASITYFQKNFKNQIDSKTLVPSDSKYAGDYGFASYVNNAEANVSGWEIVLSREHDDRLSGSISYSYMIAEGQSEYADQTINFAQWGFALPGRLFPLSWDQRHTLKVDAEFRLPYEIQGNVVFLYNSPRPYTYYPTRDGFTPLEPSRPFLPNNARMYDVAFVNAKFSKQFLLDEAGRNVLSVYVDVRNLLNRKNARWMDASGRIGGELGDPSAYYDLRRVRVGMKFGL